MRVILIILLCSHHQVFAEILLVFTVEQISRTQLLPPYCVIRSFYFTPLELNGTRNYVIVVITTVILSPTFYNYLSPRACKIKGGRGAEDF